MQNRGKVHDAGGIVSPAYPVEYGLEDNGKEILIKNLMDYGLEAIGTIHLSQDFICSKKLQDIAVKNKLAFMGEVTFMVIMLAIPTSRGSAPSLQCPRTLWTTISGKW